MKNFPFKHWESPLADLYKNLLLVLIYSGVGFVFLGLVQPGFALPLFPPAGIALAALILFGMRLWSGVLLGALLLELAVALSLDFPSGWWGLICIAPVQLFQAWVGCWLTRRLTGFQVRYMLRFTLLVAPVCCFCGVVPALWILHAAGVIASNELWSSALVWWLGDVLGILLIAPPMFVFFGKPRDYWQPLRLSVALPIGVTLVLLLVTFMYVLGEERNNITTRFEREGQQMAATLNRHLANEEEMVLAMERLMRLQPDLSDQDWQAILQPWMAQHPGAQKFVWVPYVRRDERAAFEEKMRRAGYANFSIHDSEGNPVPEADGYLPYALLTPPPAEGERNLLGLDISNQLTAQHALAGGNRIEPIRTQGNGAEVVLYHFVQMDGATAESGASGATGDKSKLQGLVAETVNAHNLLAAVLPAVMEGMEACIVERFGDALRHLAGAEGCEKPAWQHQHFFQSYPLFLVDRKGELYTRVPVALRLSSWGWDVWISMTVCTLMVALLAIFLLTQLNKLRRSHVQTNRRLTQLSAFSERLQEQTEVLLWSQRVFQMGSWEMRADGYFVASNELCTLLGVAAGELDSWEKLLARVVPEDRNKLQKMLADVRATLVATADAQATSGKASIDCRILPAANVDATTPKETDRVLSFFISNIAEVGATMGTTVDAEVDAASPASRQLGIVQDVTARRIPAMPAPEKQSAVRLADNLLESALRQGLENNEFLLHYQPLVSAADGRAVGCEAFVRWQHPQMGLLLPARFLPTAQDSGLILPLEEWIFAAACRQQIQWAAHKLTVAVNVSVQQFSRDDFLKTLTHTLEQTGADPRYLELEITGGTLMLPGEILLERCKFLRGLGFGIVLDNFGLGYASMTHMRRLHMTRLKLDRSFTIGLPDDADNCAITKATLAMAPELGLEVCAKGVETTAQLKFLKEQGCLTLQGFLFGKPMDAGQFENWLGRRSGG